MTTPLNVPIPSIDELQRNAARLLQQAFQYASQAGNAASMSTSDLELARSNTKVLAFIDSVGLHGAYRYLRDFIARQAIPIYSSGEFLRGWMATYGMKFKEAKATYGTLHGTGVYGALIPAGTVLQTDTGFQVQIVADATVGSWLISTSSAIAVVPGSAALTNGTKLNLVSPLPGVDSEFVVYNDWTPGADAETEAQAIYRLQQRLSNEPMGGAPGDYARWALSVAGITRAWGIRNPAGATSAGVIVMADGNLPSVSSYGLPTTAQLQQVSDYISDPFRGPPDELFVLAPIPVVISPVIHLDPDTPAIRADVAAGLKDLFFREAQPGGSIPHGHLIEVVSEVAGEYNHSWVSPALTQGSVFTVPSYQHMLVLDEPAFS